MKKLNHLDERGAARMVDVASKNATERAARASGIVRMRPETLAQISLGKTAKGNVVETARLAGIMAAKRTADLIPLCHPLPLESVDVQLTASGDDALRIDAAVRTTAKTGVEMEALTAVSVAALTIYDMCKAIDRDIAITDIKLEEKTGGKSGDYRRPASG